MSSDVPADKSRRHAYRLPSETKPGSTLRLTSGIQPEKGFGGRSSVLRLGDHSKSELDSAGSKHWAITSEGFPPGVTVDELKHYRRRQRQQIDDILRKDSEQPQDRTSESYKSEYARRFKAYDPTELELCTESRKTSSTRRKRDTTENNKEDTASAGEYKESFKDFPRERPIHKRPQPNIWLTKDQPMETATELRSQYVPYVNPERAKLLRRSTALKPEGEMVSETEVRSQFREYENPEKAMPIRRPPSLRLEGDFESMMTEQKEKYIGHLLGERPVIKKKSTLLKMEGDFDFLTEKQVSYVQHGLNERPYPRKRSTSLKLDGEVEFFPEYRSCYVEFPRTRPITYKPTENLKNEGELESQTETRTKFIDFREFPASYPARPINNLQMEGGLEIRPEYKENFVDFPRSRPFTMRPENHLRQEGDFDLRTENSEELSKILTEDVQRPLRVRRESNLKLEGDLEFLTEKREQFKEYGVTDRQPPARRDGNLLLEGNFDFTTENIDKYVANAVPEPGDFRKKSSLLPSGGSIFGTSPRIGSTVKTKLIPYKTEHYDSELLENCNRRTSRRNSKRLKENSPVWNDPFATIQRTCPIKRDESLKLEDNMISTPECRRKFPPKDHLRLDTVEYSHCQNDKTYDPAAHYQAFEVIDNNKPCYDKSKTVKIRDDPASDDTSDTASVTNHQPSFRLEVYNVDAPNPQGFHRGTQRVFPSEGIPTETVNFGPDSFLERKRNEYYGKNVNCPEVPNYILDKNNNVGGTGLWDTTRKAEDATLNILNKYAGPAVLDEKLSSPDSVADGSVATWSRPNWLTT